jgi:phage baseplate assembly protein W
MAILYKGFSTFNRNKKFKVVDFELIKQDLINHFYIRKGEKLMQPNFGTIIWDIIFEPLTTASTQAIIDDVKAVASYDPRISVDNIIITEIEYGIQIQLDLTYIQTNQVSALQLQFDKNSLTLTTS